MHATVTPETRLKLAMIKRPLKKLIPRLSSGKLQILLKLSEYTSVWLGGERNIILKRGRR